MQPAMAFYTYMLLCSDGTYYTGHTDDLRRRLSEHEHGVNCGYTKRRRPIELAWNQQFPTRDQAKLAEGKIKSWSQAKKRSLIKGDFDLISRLAKGKR